jgi:hypothetical protein
MIRAETLYKIVSREVGKEKIVVLTGDSVWSRYQERQMVFSSMMMRIQM